MKKLLALALASALLMVPRASQALLSQEPPRCIAAGVDQVNDGALEAAVDTLDACIPTLDPSDAPSLADAYLHRGVALVGLRQENAAKASFRKVLEYAPTFEPGPDAFSPQVIRVFKAARAGKTKSVIDRPNTTVRKAGIGASGVAAIVGGVALAGGGAAAVIAAKPSATSTVPPIPSPTLAPTVTPSATPTDRPAPSPTATCRGIDTWSRPVWVRPAQPDQVVSGIQTIQCALDPADAAFARCTTGMQYWFRGVFMGVSTDPSFTFSWDTTTFPNGSEFLVCALQATDFTTYKVVSNAIRGALVQNGTATPTASVTATSTATATGTATNTATPTDAAATPTPTPAPTQTPTPGFRSDGRTTVADAAATHVTWTSALSSTGGKGQVWLNGASVLIQPSSQQTVSLPSDPAANTIEGELLEGRGAGAVWTFQLRSGFKPGSLKPQSGNADQVLPDTIVFRLGGRKGERVAFTFEAAAR